MYENGNGLSAADVAAVTGRGVASVAMAVTEMVDSFGLLFCSCLP